MNVPKDSVALTILAALGHEPKVSDRCTARVAVDRSRVGKPGPKDPPVYCVLKAGHDGPHRSGYDSPSFRPSDKIEFLSPVTLCTKCRIRWPCPDAQAALAAAPPAQEAKEADGCGRYDVATRTWSQHPAQEPGALGREVGKVDELIRMMDGSWVVCFRSPTEVPKGTPVFLATPPAAPRGEAEESQHERDGRRFRWLTDDHADPVTRKRCRDLIGHMPCASLSFMRDNVDIAMAEDAKRQAEAANPEPQP